MLYAGTGLYLAGQAQDPLQQFMQMWFPISMLFQCADCIDQIVAVEAGIAPRPQYDPCGLILIQGTRKMGMVRIGDETMGRYRASVGQSDGKVCRLIGIPAQLAFFQIGRGFRPVRVGNAKCHSVTLGAVPSC